MSKRTRIPTRLIVFGSILALLAFSNNLLQDMGINGTQRLAAFHLHIFRERHVKRHHPCHLDSTPVSLGSICFLEVGDVMSMTHHLFGMDSVMALATRAVVSSLLVIDLSSDRKCLQCISRYVHGVQVLCPTLTRYAPYLPEKWQSLEFKCGTKFNTYGLCTPEISTQTRIMSARAKYLIKTSRDGIMEEWLGEISHQCHGGPNNLHQAKSLILKIILYCFIRSRETVVTSVRNSFDQGFHIVPEK
jgi:hypothetical protein